MPVKIVAPTKIVLTTRRRPNRATDARQSTNFDVGWSIHNLLKPPSRCAETEGGTQSADEPITALPRRLMVQARQIVVYARADLAGWYAGGKGLAQAAFETVCRRYRSADGAPGWLFSVQPDGRPADRTRDLYTHAFVLYMLAWLYRMDGEPSMLALADETL